MHKGVQSAIFSEEDGSMHKFGSEVPTKSLKEVNPMAERGFDAKPLMRDEQDSTCLRNGTSCGLNFLFLAQMLIQKLNLFQRMLDCLEKKLPQTTS